LLQQAILFAPIFGHEIIAIAGQFSQDNVAIVRNWSVGLRVELVRDKGQRGECIGRLVENRLQTRLVAAKAIREIGAGRVFEVMAETFTRNVWF
jgi:hypothetical protein